MPFVIPSLLERSRGVWGSIRARLTGSDGEILPNNLRIIGKVIAMAAHEGDLRATRLFKQIFASTAEKDYLDLHAYETGLARKPATASIGNLVFAATPGATFAAGLRFVRDADGAFVVSTAAATASGNSVTIPVAAEDAGQVGSTAAGATFTPAVPIADLADTGEADTAGLGGGADAEKDEPLRARILFRKRNRPRGGAVADYELWATEVPGIATAYAKGWQPGAGAVSVWPLKAGSGLDRIPTEGDLVPVAAYLETKRPATAAVFVVQPVARTIPVVISNLDRDTLAVRAEIQAELLDMFDERAAVALPGETTTFYRAWIDEAISAAVGENAHDLIFPASDLVLVPGEFPVLDTVTFT